MMAILQRGLLWSYRTIRSTGFLDSTIGRRLFENAYEIYKLRFEAREIDALCREIVPGTFVIDIGANIGTFTRRFARALQGRGSVIAIEPEAVNFRSLVRKLQGSGYEQWVEPIQAVAAERSGTLRLQSNADNPGDHKIADDGVEVKAVTVDELMAARGWPRVSLIKIDVQGAEERVIRGAAETIRRQHPILFVEFHDQELRAMGSSAQALLERLVAESYSIHQLSTAGRGAPLQIPEALSRLGHGYLDFLFVPRR